MERMNENMDQVSTEQETDIWQKVMSDFTQSKAQMGNSQGMIPNGNNANDSLAGEKPEGKAEAEEPDKQNKGSFPDEYVRELRREAKKYRLELQKLRKDYESAVKRADRSKMEETERLKAEKAEAEEKAKLMKDRADNMLKQSAIVSVASKMGFRDPQDAVAMIELSNIDIDEEGNIDVDEAEEMVKQVLEEKPYLAMQTQEADASKAVTAYSRFGPTNPPSNAIVRAGRGSDVVKLDREISTALAQGNGRLGLGAFLRKFELLRDRK